MSKINTTFNTLYPWLTGNIESSTYPGSPVLYKSIHGTLFEVVSKHENDNL